MKLYCYQFSRNNGITIEEIEANEKKVIYETTLRTRIHKTNIDTLTGFCGNIMYSLSKNNIELFKNLLIKKYTIDINHYDEKIKHLKTKICEIQNANPTYL